MEGDKECEFLKLSVIISVYILSRYWVLLYLIYASQELFCVRLFYTKKFLEIMSLFCYFIYGVISVLAQLYEKWRGTVFKVI